MSTMFKQSVAAVDDRFTSFHRLETLQVNLGDLCNLSCSHCHHHASPRGVRIMGRGVMEKIAAFLARTPGLTLDMTGGCPEMNPDFRYLVEMSAGLATRRIVRSNLAIALEAGMEWLPDFYRRHHLVVMASLPCYEADNVEIQRGSGVYNRSIEALRRLNSQGYGSELELHLVYNPAGSAVAGGREVLEEHYRRELLQRFGITFNRLHCMNNTPLGRFRDQLEQSGGYEGYIKQLAAKFNPDATERIMCRSLVSVAWNGLLYNCDFNLAADLPLLGGDGSPLGIERIDEAILTGSVIRMADHCFSCTAGQGSGCGGSLKQRENRGAAITHKPGERVCCQ